MLGDLTRDGTDELAAGVYTLGIWSLADLEGTVDEADAARAVGWDGETEWITGVSALGDVDGDGVVDMALQADDWPDEARQGTLALLSGADLLPAGTTDFGAVRVRLEGASAGDSFGYRATLLGDHDGDGRPDLAVGVPGSDLAGTNAGAVVLAPLPW